MQSANAQQVRQNIQAAHAAMKRGDLAVAERYLSGIDHPEAHFLMAMLSQQRGDMAAAENGYRRALEQQPKFVQAAEALGRLFIDSQRWQDAQTVYEDILARDPDNMHARYGLGNAFLGIGECERAASLFDSIIRAGIDGPEMRFLRGRAKLDMGEIEAGLQDVRAAHDSQATPFSLRTLAGTLWMLDEREQFESLLNEALRQPDLLPIAADLLRQSGKPEQAIAALSQQKDLPLGARAVLIRCHAENDDPVAAEKVARACLSAAPHNMHVGAWLIPVLLMQGKASEALARVMPLRHAEPENQLWIAYEATALRMLGDARYETLVDMDRFVRVYELPVPKGFDSLAEFNSAFLTALDRFHRYSRHPLDQTFRHGSQTPRELSRAEDPVIDAYFDALDTPIRDYMSAVGNSKAHPLTARNTGDYRIAGCWSVRLRGGGWHVNHVHPEGWISSAYYVSVPGDVADESSKAGWIKFGEPPFRTEIPTPAQKWVCPTAGMVVLFPSFLWHGTEAILDGSVRVTAPFDLRPV
jgi:tetratricopeptide (TPR) repeat protein